MNKLSSVVPVCFAFAAGCLVGQSLPEERLLQATSQQSERLSDDAAVAYKRAVISMNELEDILISEGRHNPASEDQNYFAVSVGGIDALRDLEEGRGVDPETFAALYAERGLPEIAEELDFDSQDRLRYKGHVVRMYSRERLKKLFRQRDEALSRSDR